MAESKRSTVQAAPAEARALANRYRIISELTSDYAYAFSVSPEGQIELEWVTDGLTRLTGFSLDELTDLGGWERLIHSEDLPIPTQQLKQLLAGEQITVEYRIVRRDGTIRWMRDCARPERDATGQVVRLYGAVQDISERKLARTAFEESEQRYRWLVDLIPDAVVVLQGGVYKYTSPAFHRMFGYSKLDVAHGLSFFELVQDKDKAEVRRRYEDRLAGNPVEDTFIIDLIAEDGRVVPCETSATLIQFDGSPADLAIIRDVSARARLEGQLRQAQKMEALGTLAGGVAHDMNNILGMILGLASLMETQSDADDPRRPDLERVIAATRRGSSLTGDLLRFARRGTTRKGRLSLNDTVVGVIDLLRRTAPKGTTIKTVLADDLADVDADPDQFLQAVMNVCLNSVHALADSGTLTVETRNATADDQAPPDLGPCRHVQVVVTDDGCGMSAETVESAFDPFFTTKPVGEGTGLGLATVYATMRNHQGAVSLESHPDHGTKVTLYVPAMDPERDTEDRTSPTPANAPGGAGTVLLADDEEVIRHVGMRMLEGLGYDVLTAGDGSAALNLYREHHSELTLVILDIAMPVMGGVDCTREMQALDASVPILICSGTIMSDTAGEALAAGATATLAKPFDIDRLGEAVRAAIETAQK